MLTLLIGLVLVGVVGALVARVAALPRINALARVEQVAGYGLADAAPTVIETKGAGEPALQRLASSVGTAVATRVEKIDLEEIRRMLLQAGHYNTRAETFVGYQVLGTLVVIALLILRADTTLLGIVTAVGILVCAPVVPQVMLKRSARRRVQTIEDDLPDLIDLLIVTVEAGLSLSSSLKTASRRVQGPLGEELRLAMQEQRMGLPVSDVLQNMLQRGDSPSMRSFVRSLVQGETLGVSIGTIMRNLAHEMRARRRSRAEERANKAPVKMLFPLIFLIFPALLIVLLGPAVMEITKALGAIA